MFPESLAERLLVGLIVLLLVAGGSFYAGYHYASQECKAKQGDFEAKALIAQQDAVKKALDKQQAEQQRLNTVSQGAEDDKQQVQVVYRTIKQQVIKYVKEKPTANNQCLDADGLRIWQAANTGRNVASPVAPDPGVASTAVPENVTATQ